MNTKDKRSLWSNSTQTQYFLIPDDEALPTGNFILCSLKGDKKNVDSTAITSFEITESEAKAYLQAEMNQALEEAKNAFSNFMAFSTQSSQEIPSNSTPSLEQTRSNQNLISALLGVTPEELQNNPDAAKTAFLNLYTQLKKFVGESTSKNPTEVDAVRSRLQSLRETFSTQGIKISGEIEELPKKLQEVLSSSNIEEYLKEIVDKLRDFADQIDKSPDAVGQKIDEMIHSSLKDLFIEEEKRLEEKRKQQYRQSAQDAIAQSFKNMGIPSFAGGDLKVETSEEDET
ncbi:MAG TPA: hypothetical protein DEG17_20390 [Cyanobacteria bacterium UBA11149]|nr:hypothetical protein [Cyanobacteria bacterium UBA11367]HBE57714.1 hypothetical protein [Cyanobacteria bacterium UBA11366]HBK64502.1 hypothetical protein [Cyanobacteria bacterium UBA11166]HBR75816.1 hypothetical protein [Cyanobacteria bacterium UBA11159]HBS72321.1 hypothetical protein [Cyanobacteria bacterium UBA11153]HBW91155.1 hypothetical protein [Cyanobacteria bacterium UBA11149]HCA94384.1 hypothetical protein [Cyanobacteria bacterium UBA9226]